MDLVAAVLFAGVHEAVGSFDDFVCALASVSDGGADTDGDADLLVVTGQPPVTLSVCTATPRGTSPGSNLGLLA